MSNGAHTEKPSYKTRRDMETAEGRDWTNAVISHRGTFYTYRDGNCIKNFFIKSCSGLDRPEIKPIGYSGQRFFSRYVF